MARCGPNGRRPGRRAEPRSPTGDALIAEIGPDRGASPRPGRVPYVGTPAADLNISPRRRGPPRRARRRRSTRRPASTLLAAPDGRCPRRDPAWPSARRARPPRRQAAVRRPPGQVQGRAEARSTEAEASSRPRAHARQPGAHGGRLGPRPVADPQRRPTTGAARPVRRSRRSAARSPTTSATRSRPSRPRAPAAARLPGPDRDHGRDRAGRDERRGHRHRGGQGPLADALEPARPLPSDAPRPTAAGAVTRPGRATLRRNVHPPAARPNIAGPASRSRRIRRP